MSLLKTFLIQMAETFPNATYGKASNFSLFPCMVYNMIGSNTTRANSYDSISEQFTFQISYFDDSENCEDIIDLQEETEDAFYVLKHTPGNIVREIKKVSTIGPRYIRDQKYWQIIDTYQIMICGEEDEARQWFNENNEVIPGLSYPLVNMVSAVSGWTSSIDGTGLCDLRYVDGTGTKYGVNDINPYTLSTTLTTSKLFDILYYPIFANKI